MGCLVVGLQTYVRTMNGDESRTGQACRLIPYFLLRGFMLYSMVAQITLLSSRSR